MFLRRVGIAFVGEHLQGIDQARARLARLDHVVDVARAGRVVGIVESPAVLLGQAPALGRGIGRAMLRHIVAEAKARGYKRLSLETGNTEPFAAALHLYASEGFQPWGPFAGYSDTPLSSFLTRRL